MDNSNEVRHEIHNGKRYEIVNEGNWNSIEINGLKYPAGMTDWQVKFHETHKPALCDILMGGLSVVSLGAGSVFAYMGLENMVSNNSVEAPDVLLVGCALSLLYGSLRSFRNIGKLYRK